MNTTEVSFSFLLNHDHFAQSFGQQSDYLVINTDCWAPLPLTKSELTQENAVRHWKNNSEFSVSDYLGDDDKVTKQERDLSPRTAEEEKQQESAVPN